MNDNPNITEARDDNGKLISVTVKLSEPVTAHGQQKTEIVFKPPKVKLRVEAGDPYSVLQTPSGKSIQILSKVILFYAWKLAGVPPTTFDELDGEDWDTIEAAILLFFGERTAAKPDAN